MAAVRRLASSLATNMIHQGLCCCFGIAPSSSASCASTRVCFVLSVGCELSSCLSSVWCQASLFLSKSVVLLSSAHITQWTSFSFSCLFSKFQWCFQQEPSFNYLSSLIATLVDYLHIVSLLDSISPSHLRVK